MDSSEADETMLFEFTDDQDSIEAVLRHSLVYLYPTETRTGNMWREIRLRMDGTLTDRKDWDEHIEWFLEYGERFHEVFADRLHNLS